MIFVELLYDELFKERNLKLPKVRTSPFYMFNSNIGRALMLPTLKYGPETDDDWAPLDTAFLHQAAIAQIITSLEVYYESVFRVLSSSLNVSKIEPTALVHFIRDNKLANELLSVIDEKGILDVRLSDIVPENFSFQQKDKIKSAMALVRLDPISIYKTEWERTYGDKEDSTLKLRHAFVHGGINYQKLFDTIVKERMLLSTRIKDAIMLVASVESQIRNKYSRVKSLFPRAVNGAR